MLTTSNPRVSATFARRVILIPQGPDSLPWEKITVFLIGVIIVIYLTISQSGSAFAAPTARSSGTT
jgi:hypothetical protein